jgi:hypothetical protein
MVQLIHEVAQLCFQIGDLSVCIPQVCLLRFQIERFLVNQPIEFLHTIQLLADLEFQLTDVARQVLPLLLLHFIAHIETIDFFEVVPVAVTQG